MDIIKAINIGMATAGINQNELASKSGIHPSMISVIMNGHRSLTLKTMEKIADALGMKLSALIALGE